MGGSAVFHGTRVPVQTLLDYLEAGESIDDFPEKFPSVTREHVIAFLEEAKDRVIDAASVLAAHYRPVGHPWSRPSEEKGHARCRLTAACARPAAPAAGAAAIPVASHIARKPAGRGRRAGVREPLPARGRGNSIRLTMCEYDSRARGEVLPYPAGRCALA
jgi:uncharacterized protein (DUF433 family)